MFQQNSPRDFKYKNTRGWKVTRANKWGKLVDLSYNWKLFFWCFLLPYNIYLFTLVFIQIVTIWIQKMLQKTRLTKFFASSVNFWYLLDYANFSLFLELLVLNKLTVKVNWNTTLSQMLLNINWNSTWNFSSLLDPLSWLHFFLMLWNFRFILYERWIHIGIFVDLFNYRYDRLKN